MAKNPSIHVTKSVLRSILRSYGLIDSEDLLEYIFENARPHQLYNRALVVSGSDRKPVAKDKLEAEQVSDAEAFNTVLTLERRKAGHLFPALSRDERAWQVLVKISKVAATMADDFNISKAEAFSAYAKLGVSMMGTKYSIQRLLSYKDRIYQALSEEMLVAKDTNPVGTSQLRTAYEMEFHKRHGQNFHQYPDHALHFVLAREMADKLNADYREFVVSQVHGLEFTGGFPEPQQLHTPNAETRYMQYLRTMETAKPVISSISEYMGD